MVDDAFDECGGAGGAREDGVPIGEGEVGGEDEALLLVTSADDLEDQVGVAIVEREKAQLVDDEKANLCVVMESPLEGARGLLGPEVEQ